MNASRNHRLTRHSTPFLSPMDALSLLQRTFTLPMKKHFDYYSAAFSANISSTRSATNNCHSWNLVNLLRSTKMFCKITASNWSDIFRPQSVIRLLKRCTISKIIYTTLLKIFKRLNYFWPICIWRSRKSCRISITMQIFHFLVMATLSPLSEVGIICMRLFCILRNNLNWSCVLLAIRQVIV